jgi:hypothetical protein
MTKKINHWYGIIGGFVLLVFSGILAWVILKIWLLFWDYISHAQPEVGAAIIAGSFTVIISVLSVVIARAFERNKELAQMRWEKEQEIRKQYIPIYQELVKFLFRIFTSSKTGNPMSPEELNQFFVSFTQEILVWGSDKFIKEFSEFRESSVEYAERVKGGNATKDDLIETMEKLEHLLYSVRVDCGHENKGLGKGDLLTLFINDICKIQERTGSVSLYVNCLR